MSNRPPIPAHIERQVKVEAGHRCAIPTCRQLVGLELHHITPWSRCKEHKADNLILLCSTCHILAHEGRIDRKSLRMYKAQLQKLHDVYSQFEVDVLFHCYNNKIVQFPTYLRLLIIRLLDSNFVRFKDSGIHMQVGGIEHAPALIELTDEGKEYVACLIQGNQNE